MRTAFWILSIRPIAEREGADIAVARCGEYHRRRRATLGRPHLLRWEDALGRPLRLAAGVAYLADLENPLVPLGVFSRPEDSPRRPLVVAEGPCRRPYGDRPLEGAAGEHLARILGIDLSALLESFEVVNAGEHVDASTEERAQGAGRILDRIAGTGRPVVTLGGRAREAMEVAAGGPSALRRELPQLETLPHPSGRNLLLNEAAERRRVRAVLVDALLSARRGLSELGAREAAGNIQADGHRPAWDALVRLGIAAPSRCPRANWTRVAGGDEERFERRWSAGSAVVCGGPPWEAHLWQDGRRQDLPVLAELGAALVQAELAARESGWRTAFEVREAALAVQTSDTGREAAHA
jgi:hypothetical protein